jgi:single-strand DNA-binding protein
MRSVNKVILVGHLAADPEQYQTKSGRLRVTFPIATHRDSTSEGMKKEVIDYHRVVAWGPLGETCAKYLSRGQGVYVEGIILNRAYERDGERRYVTEIRADEVNMLTWKRRGGVSNVNLQTLDPEPAKLAA